MPARHNFEQIRLPVRGDMNIGRGTVLREGQSATPGRHGVRTAEDPLGRRGSRRARAARACSSAAVGHRFHEASSSVARAAGARRTGWFDGNLYHRPDGTVQWGLTAIWEHVYGTLKYPRPRYQNVIIADSEALPLSCRRRQVEHKYLGAFSDVACGSR